MSAKRIGILTGGGDVPGLNSVIKSVVYRGSEMGCEVIGIRRGWEGLTHVDLREPASRTRYLLPLSRENTRTIDRTGGTYLHSSRTNPSKMKKLPPVLEGQSFPQKESTKEGVTSVVFDVTKAVLANIATLNLDYLISIGGDDTLKTAYYLHLLGVPVVHVPKTIDNDYFGIPWTFGYFTAIEAARQAVKVYNQEAQTTDAWWILELMGRKTGWYTLGAGISGEAVRMIGPEEVGPQVDINKLAGGILDLILQREKIGKHYGVVLVSEGLVDKLPPEQRPQEVDTHGNVKFSEAFFGHKLAKLIGELYAEEKKKAGEKTTKLQIKSETVGYTTRCVEPSAFDILLGSQLGMGAFKLVRECNFGSMVSVGDNMELRSVPFDDLIDPVTFRTRLRYVPINGDFFKMAKALEFRRQFDV